MTPADAVRGRWRVLAIAAIYAVACWIMLAPIFSFAHPATAHFGGDTRLIIWTLAWDNHALLDRVPSLFDANIFYPASNALAYSEHLYGISLFTLPVYALSRNPVLAYNVVWVLAFFLSAASAHLLAWRHTKDHLAALVAGLTFGFCFYRMHQGHGHLHMVWDFWIPLSLVAMERWFDAPTWRRLALFVAVVVLQALASWYQAVMILIADALLLLWLVLVERPRPNGADARARLSRFTLQAAVGGVVALALVWPFARHYYVLAGEGPAAVAAGGADLAGYLVPPENTFAGQWLIAHGYEGPRWIWGEVTVYLGWITMALASLGAIIALRGRDDGPRRLRFFAILGVVAIALAAGPLKSEVTANAWGWSPFGVLMRLPGVNLFRVPARFTELLTLALSMLAAAGCAALHARFGRIGRVVTAVAIPLALCEFYVVNFPGGPPVPFPVPAIYKVVATLPPGAVVSLPDLADTPIWFDEADYQYFSTVHWRPIANGYSRAEPPGFRALMARLKTFPSPTAAAAMRATPIAYVVLHAGRIREGGRELASQALASPAFRLVARSADDYLFEVVSGGPQ